MRTGGAQALDAGCPVLYDVAAAELGVTSLFGAAGRGYYVAPAKRGVTSLFGLAGRGNILRNLEE